MAKQMSVGGTPSDVVRLLADFEATADVTYVECGTFDEPNPPRFESSTNIPLLGVATYGKAPLEPAYLVICRSAPVRVELIENGHSTFVVDQLLNPDSIVYRPCGKHHSGTIIMGTVGTIGSSQIANHLFNSFRNAVRRNCKSVHGNWLGPEALGALRSGTRITANIISPPEYDIVESE